MEIRVVICVTEGSLWRVAALDKFLLMYNNSYEMGSRYN